MRNGSKVRVFEIHPHEKYTDIRVGCSKKKDGQYINDYSGYVRLLGQAHEKAGGIRVDENIRIDDIAVGNWLNPRTQQTKITVVANDITLLKHHEPMAEADELGDTDEIPF